MRPFVFARPVALTPPAFGDLLVLFKELPLAPTVDDYGALLPWNIAPGEPLFHANKV